MSMKRFETTIRFLTPAFLGDAFQRGRWRTPPFKALLREWWRIAAAKDHGYDWRCLREKEGRLFGHAFLTHNGNTWAMRSRVSLRIDRWSEGSCERWSADTHRVQHPEVGPRGAKIDPLLYLGYGPLAHETGQGTTFAPISTNSPIRRSAIATEEKARMVLRWPSNVLATAKEVLRLVHAFGTLGSRCRNGWGSIAFGCHENTTFDQIRGLAASHARPLEECLSLDWPHAFGTDGRGPLVWRTRKAHSNWQSAMRELAEIKIAFRTALPWRHNRGNGGPVDERHILAYPVTNHRIDHLVQERLANQLRFKVIRYKNEFWGIAYHLPHKIPDESRSSLRTKYHLHDRHGILGNELGIWRRVHSILDNMMQR